MIYKINLDQSKAPPTDMYSGGFDDEPPLLEELGINFDHIYQKTVAVMNPWKHTSSEVINEGNTTLVELAQTQF